MDQTSESVDKLTYDEDMSDGSEDSDFAVVSCTIYDYGEPEWKNLIKSEPSDVVDSINATEECSVIIEEEEKVLSDGCKEQNYVDINEEEEKPKEEIFSSENESCNQVILMEEELSHGNSSVTQQTTKNQKVNKKVVEKFEKKSVTKKSKNLEIMTNDEYEIAKSLVQLKCKKCEMVTEPTQQSANICPKCNWKLGFSCNICSALFFKLSNTLTHIFKFHKRAEQVEQKSLGNIVKEIFDYRCWKCAAAYKTKVYRDKHESKCRIVPNFYCSFCPTSTTSQEQLVLHLLKHHYRLFEESDLEALSTNEIPVISDSFKDLGKYIVAFCYKCKESFPSPKNDSLGCLKCHMQLNYVCNHIRCNKSTNIYTNLDKIIFHLRQEHLELYPCKRCSWPFNTLTQLSKHVPDCGKKIVKNPEKSIEKKFIQYYCKMCQKSFETRSGLNLHEAMWCQGSNHLVRYHCAHCTYQGFDKQRLLMHINHSHVDLFHR